MRLLLFLIFLTFSTLAGGGPQNLVLVVNTNSEASIAVANAYIDARHVPAGNVIYLDDVPNFETIDIDTFREKILKPILKAIEDRGLKPQIDMVVYSADMPYAVNTSADKLPKPLPKVFTRTASITGLTYLYERVLAKDTSYLNLSANRYMRRPLLPGNKTARNDQFGADAFNADEQKSFVEAMQLHEKKDYAAALPLLQKLNDAHPKSSDVAYNFACTLARLKRDDEAMTALQNAIDNGWFNVWHTREDEDLVSLRQRPDFKALLAKLETIFVTTTPTRAFHAADAWTPEGELAADGKGEHYLLSTMLAETSGRGTSFNEAVEALRKSAHDGAQPKGTIYYMTNGDVRSRTRRWGFTSAVHELQALGVHAEIVAGNLPQEKTDVLGLMAGLADFNWSASKSAILPGAICEHLTSCGGELAQYRGQTACTQFIRNGAAGTSGAVEEPFALQQKFPSPFIHVHYARGSSLAEAFYQSVSGPYQLIVLGDPLCAPWLHAPEVSLNGLPAEGKLKGQIELRPVAAEKVAVKRFELFVDGIRHSAAAQGGAFTIDAPTLSAGPHQLLLVGIADDALEGQGRFEREIVVDNPAKPEIVTPPQHPSLIWQRNFLEPHPHGAAATAPGFLVHFSETEKRIVEPKRGENWLAEAGLKKGGQCKAEGYLTAATKDIYQLQLKTNLALTVKVDGQTQPFRTSRNWQCLLLPLNVGEHHLEITATAESGTALDLRFGLAGTHNLEKSDIICIKPE